MPAIQYKLLIGTGEYLLLDGTDKLNLNADNFYIFDIGTTYYILTLGDITTSKNPPTIRLVSTLKGTLQFKSKLK